MKIVSQAITIFYEQIDQNLDALATSTGNASDHSITKYVDATETIQMTPSRNGGLEQRYELFKQFGETHRCIVYLFRKYSGALMYNGLRQQRQLTMYQKKNYGTLAIDGNGRIFRTEPYFDPASNSLVTSNVRSLQIRTEKF